MFQVLTSSTISVVNMQASRLENGAPTLVWEPKVLKVKGLRLWEVENDRDVIQFCKKQLSKVCSRHRFTHANCRPFQQILGLLVRPTKASGILMFTGWKW